MEGLREEVGMENPKKEIENRSIVMTSHITLSNVPYAPVQGRLVQAFYFFKLRGLKF